MQYQIPQFINIKNKIVGPLSFRDLLLIGVAAGIIVALRYSGFTPFFFFLLSGITVAVFGAVIFYKPGGRPAVAYFGSVLRYLVTPNLLFWRTPAARKSREEEQSSIPPERAPEEKKRGESRLKELARSFQTEKRIKEKDPDTYLV